MNRAVFLDRDGTLIRDKHYLHDPDEVEWLPGVKSALGRLGEAGYLLVVVTNQSGVGRGMFPETRVRAVHRRMQGELGAEHEVSFAGLYYATLNPENPHPSEEERWLRKPRPGMLERAGRELDIDCGRSYMVGDKPSDVQAGRRAGCETVLVTGTGGHAEQGVEAADVVVKGLREAAEWILGRSNPPSQGRERE